MGCDIHLAVERRTDAGWQRAEPMVPPRWTYDGGPEEERERWYSGRNYSCSPFWETVGTAWWGLVARMARVAGDDLSSVRIVFWFDN